MQKFRKLPVVIEAIQWDGEQVTLSQLAKWWPPMQPVMMTPQGLVRIPTLEGSMLADEGDWIIRGIKGEVYPCDPDIFDATYELVE